MTITVPLTYPNAKTDRNIYDEPTLPPPQVGEAVTDPVFGTPLAI